MRTIRAVDLFCGKGGWAHGLIAAGWTVRGYDIEDHGGYPGELVLRDVLELTGDDVADAELIVASPRYFYDDIGSREACAGTARARRRGVNPKAVSATSGVRLPRCPSAQTPGRIRSKQNASFSAAVVGLVAERRMRTVWSIGGEPYHGAHYACFPRELARRCIAAATSERGVCPRCGAPWARVVERQPVGDWARDQERKARGVASCRFPAPDRTILAPRAVGWRPSCTCAAGAAVPALVLDPFGGSGTTAEVAYRMGRAGISVDVAYQELQRERLGLFAGSGT